MSKCDKCGAETKESVKYCKACGASQGSGTSLNEKKARVMSSEKRWVKPAVIAAAIVLIAAVAWTAKGTNMSKKTEGHPLFAPRHDQSARLANAVMVKEQGGSVTIPLASIDDGKAHFYAYSAGGKTITFFVMKAADGSVRTAFDACMACNHAKLGYRQESDFVVCNNCGMSFQPTDIGKVATRGCNPIPLEKSTEGQMIVLKAKDLEAGAQYF